MSHTVANFWAMVYDFDITAVVVLHPTSNPKSSLNKRNYGMKKCVPYKGDTLKFNSQICNTMIYYSTIFRSILAIDEKHSSLWLHIFPGDGGARGGYWLLSVMGGESEKSRDICTRVSHLMLNICMRVFGTFLYV